MAVKIPASKNNFFEKKAWVVSVDMGYGHQRAAFPLKSLAYGNEIITANTYRGIPEQDKKIWQESRRAYEFISRFKGMPLIGEKVFELYDNLQEIPLFYPRRDLSKMSLQVKTIYNLIEKKGWGRHLIEKLAKKPLPLIATFFIPAFMAEHWDYPGEIYCVTTDADINRAWAPKSPAASRINYFASNYRVVERLKLYGVLSERIFLTGFPLPPENIGGLASPILKQDLIKRLVNLDPKHNYWNLYHVTAQEYLGIKKLPAKSDHPLTLMFAIGGAGAQKEIGADIVKSLKNEILQKKIRVILVAGIHNSVSQFFREKIKAAGLAETLGRGVKIIFAGNKNDYFKKFNQALRTADILWTKPSELSFYCALGLPIIMSPPIGSQEKFNRRWLYSVGSAVTQENPKHADQWLFDWVDSGWFAEAAMEGFIETPKFGAYNIAQVIAKRFTKEGEPKMALQY